jgi:superfamily I DNA/RNA helicase
MLAMAHARRQAADGRQVLFLCFNRGLAEWLRAHVPEAEQERLRIRHFAGLCAELCREAGVRFQPPQGDEEAVRTFFRSTAPQLLEQALDRIERRFDAVVVDEAQDFAPDWWLSVELLNSRAEEGPLYMFYDPAQNLFVEEKLTFPDAVPYRLPYNCRNTRAIADTCGRVLGRAIPVWAEAPAGQATQLYVHEAPLQRRQAVDRQVREWLKAGLRPEQVAILSPWRQANSNLDGVDRIASHPLVTDLQAWREGRGVLFATVRSFKGLEADALVIVDVPAFGPPFTASDCYVACSRAKHLLSVIASARLTW